MDPRTESTVCDCKDPARAVAAPPTPKEGNPVSITTAFKVQDELDYSTADGLFRVSRRHVSTGYRYNRLPQVTFGENWQGLIPGRLILGTTSVFWMQGNGESFHQFNVVNPDNGNSWTYASPGGTRATLSMVTTPSVSRDTYFQEAAILNGPAEFRLAFGNGEYILFRRATAQSENRSAVPVEWGNASGYKQYFDYSDTGLFPYRVRDSFGREMQLSWVDTPRGIYDADSADGTIKAIKTISLPDGTTLTYDYDKADAQLLATGTDGSTAFVWIPGRKDRLGEVRRTNASGTVIWKRTYLYENGRLPYALTGIKDQDGTRLSTYSYHPSGLIASSERAGGVDRYTFRQYRLKTNGVVDENYLYHEVTNPLGRKETYKLNRHTYWMPPQVPRLILQVDGAASANVPADTQSLTYVNSTTVSSVVDKRGTLTGYTLDAANSRPTAMTEAQGTPSARATNFTWQSATQDWLTKAERPGLKVEYTYSPTGQPLTRTETDTTTHSVPYSTAGQARTWTYTWGTGGRLGSINGPKPVDGQGRDDVTSFTYDAAGNLLTSTNGLGHVTTFAGYDVNGLPASMTDANGTVTEYSYDALGRATAIRVKHPSDAQLDAVTSFEYDLEGRVTGLTQPATEKLIFDYNAGGRLTAMRVASGERIDFAYDAMGNVTAQTVKRADGSAARSIARTFDELGRMLTETLGTGRTAKWAYDKNGNATQVVSARSFATQAAFDPLNRLVSTVAPDTGTTASAYNARDEVTSFTDAISVQTTFVRNGFGEVIQEVSPDRGTSTHHYNEAGERTASIDGRGQRVDYTRDILGRVTSKTPVGHASETVTYTWDTAGIAGSYGVGRLASVTDASGTTSFAYDHRGNLTTKRQTIGSGTADLAYAYDLADRITQISYPSGRIVAYTYDGKGRVSQVSTRASASDPWTTLASSMSYEAWGALTGAQFGNGLSLSQTWAEGRLASKRLFNTSSGTNLSSLAYSYDANDNVGAIRDLIDESRSAYYGYDANDRMSFASIPVGTPTAGTETFSYTGGTNRLASVVNASGTRSIGYDGRGNTASETRPGGGTVSVTYDGYGRLLTYARTGDPAQANVYNGLDDRVSVTSGGTAHAFVYDPDGRLIGEYGTSASDVVAETIWLQPEVANDNGPIGGDDGIGGYAPLAVATGSGGSAALYWMHGNHLGVPIVTTDASGAVATPTGHTVLGFPGQLRTLADLYYNRHRDYDSSTGRYIQADPIGLEGGDNPYLYAEGNPLRYIDPLGLKVPTKPSGADVAKVAFDLWLKKQRNPKQLWRKTPWGRAWAFGELCGTAAGATIWYLNQEDEEDDDDACEEQKQEDIRECNQWNIKGPWQGYSKKEGFAICMTTVTTRNAECRARGGDPTRITTPLFLPGRRGIQEPTRW